MAWTYTGNPATVDLDKYRFLIGDTDETAPILQDGEITYLIGVYSTENERLYHLFDTAATKLARLYKNKLGTSEEDPTSQLTYYQQQAAFYRKLVDNGGLPDLSEQAPAIFRRGMHDDFTTG